MKKHLFTLIFALGISVVLNAGQTYAQSEAMLADVPFAFGVNNRTQPAGTYRINSINDSRTIWKLQGTSSGTGVLFLPGISGRGRADYGHLRLTFHRYGDKYFLVSFKTRSFEVALPRSKDEKTLMASRDKLPKMDAIAIETVAARSF